MLDLATFGPTVTVRSRSDAASVRRSANGRRLPVRERRSDNTHELIAEDRPTWIIWDAKLWCRDHFHEAQDEAAARKAAATDPASSTAKPAST